MSANIEFTICSVMGNKQVIFPYRYLDEIAPEYPFHIYYILAAPKKRISPLVIPQLKDGIFSFDVCWKNRYGKTDTESCSIPALDAFDGSLLGFDIDAADDSIGFRFHGKETARMTLSDIAFKQGNKQCITEFEILYIGQAEPNNTAQKRLSKPHEKLLKILSDFHNHNLTKDYDLYISLATVQADVLLEMGSHTIQKSGFTDGDMAAIEVFQKEQDYGQLINITEAALITTFKPKYNKKLVNVDFSLKKIDSFSHYNAFYSGISLEIDIDTDKYHFYTAHKEIVKPKDNRVKYKIEAKTRSFLFDPKFNI